MTVSLIWAQAANGIIGADGTIPWHLPEDLALFRRLTTDTTVVMGRRTWESLPERFRPLPRRRNVVLSRRADFRAAGAAVVPTLDEALRDDEVWVIGGSAVYAAALPHADRAVVTELDRPFPGDTSAPELPTSWRLRSTTPEQGWSTSTTGLGYRVRVYDARPGVEVLGGLDELAVGRTRS